MPVVVTQSLDKKSFVIISFKKPGHPELVSGSYEKALIFFLIPDLLMFHTNPLTLDHNSSIISMKVYLAFV
ncbi:MAG: hypothetical protein ABJI69_03115 [Balneola sp.]